MDSKNVKIEVTLHIETLNNLKLLTTVIDQFGSPCYGDNQYAGREARGKITLDMILNHILGSLADGVIPVEDNKWQQSLLVEFGLCPCSSTEEFKMAKIEFDKTSK
ncbi:hypothetical protein ABH307_00490 [Acinetobacter pittii]|uniref:hypothetical protein n=1 Tax=Acinetobacter pittii TaxID=48296 RepID=UPI0032616536